MKTCDEMVNSLLKRRDRYEADRKKKRMIITRTVTSMCCVCLAVLIGVGVWKGGAPDTTLPDSKSDASAETELRKKKGLTEQETNVADRVKYITMSGDWPVYGSVRELTDAADMILLGKITDISFEFTNSYLYTNYGIEVITSYKGDADGTLNLRMMGGIKGAFIAEQKAALGNSAKDGIPFMEGRPDMEIGHTYLFVLRQFESGKTVLVNIDQSVFNVRDPLAKDKFSHVSAKDIISFLGDDKWESFEAYKNTLD